jgi:hypothetical protein
MGPSGAGSQLLPSLHPAIEQIGLRAFADSGCSQQDEASRGWGKSAARARIEPLVPAARRRDACYFVRSYWRGIRDGEMQGAVTEITCHGGHEHRIGASAVAGDRHIPRVTGGLNETRPPATIYSRFVRCLPHGPVVPPPYPCCAIVIAQKQEQPISDVERYPR